jgi:hypothetical protein
MDPKKYLEGQCFCRAVTYEVCDEFEYAMNCHCSNCRRTTGSAFKPIAGIRSGKLKLVSGSEALMKVGDSDSYNAHCQRCGSLLFSLVRDGEFVHVALGTLVDEPTVRPTHHIFVGSKAPWFAITDDLPQFDDLG